ncbi:IclR family transcriptional regulator [soil metagenome]
MTTVSTESQVGIQSAEVAVVFLRAVVESRAAATLSAPAAATGMTPSKTRKYLASLVRTGLASQQSSGGKYLLGPFALELGLAALRQVDVLEFAQPTLDALRDEFTTTASLVIWSDRGPVLVRWAQTDYQTHPIRPGTIFPLLSSAPGRMFVTWMREAETHDLVSAELKDPKGAAAASGLRTMADVRKMTEEIRRQGVATIESVLAPVDVICAPVFDHNNTIVAAIVLVGFHGRGFDTDPAGPCARRVLEMCEALSRRLGAVPPAADASDAALPKPARKSPK